MASLIAGLLSMVGDAAAKTTGRRSKADKVEVVGQKQGSKRSTIGVGLSVGLWLVGKDGTPVYVGGPDDKGNIAWADNTTDKQRKEATHVAMGVLAGSLIALRYKQQLAGGKLITDEAISRILTDQFPLKDTNDNGLVHQDVAKLVGYFNRPDAKRPQYGYRHKGKLYTLPCNIDGKLYPACVDVVK